MTPKHHVKNGTETHRAWKRGDTTWAMRYVQKMSGLYVLRRAHTSCSELNHWKSSKSTTGIGHGKTRKLAVYDCPENKDAC